MSTNWEHKQLLVADFIQRSRKVPASGCSNLSLTPNLVLGSILVTITLAIVLFAIFGLSHSNTSITKQNSLASFLPKDFVLPRNLPVRGRMSNQYASSAAALYTFINSKVLDARVPKNQASRITAAIVDAGQRTGLDPLLIAAIVKAESAFKPDATSPVGAAGLMQLMPATAKFIGKKIDLQPRNRTELYNLERNLILGSAYVIYLNRMFHGSLQRTLVAYNWGPANAELAFNRRSRNIPAVTQHYTRAVISTHRVWKAEFAQRQGGYKYVGLFAN